MPSKNSSHQRVIWKAKWITKKDPKTFESNGDWMVKRFV